MNIFLVITTAQESNNLNQIWLFYTIFIENGQIKYSIYIDTYIDTIVIYELNHSLLYYYFIN